MLAEQELAEDGFGGGVADWIATGLKLEESQLVHLNDDLLLQKIHH